MRDCLQLHHPSKSNLANIWNRHVSFIPYFRCFVFGILVTFVVFCCVTFFPFFLSCPSCLKKCKQRICAILYFHNLVAKSDKKQKMGWTKHKWQSTKMSLKLFTKLGLMIHLVRPCTFAWNEDALLELISTHYLPSLAKKKHARQLSENNTQTTLSDTWTVIG